MKKTLLMVCFLSLSLILVGCSAKEIDKKVAEGDLALSEERYDDAIKAYNAALKIETSTAVIQKQQEAVLAKIDALRSEGDKLAKNGKFEEAIEKYKEIATMNPSDEEIKVVIKAAEDKIDDQELLDAYTAWLQTIVEKGTRIHSDWSSISKEVANGIKSKNSLRDDALKLKDTNATIQSEVNIRSLEDEVPRQVHDRLAAIFAKNDKLLNEIIAQSTEPQSTVTDLLTKGAELNKLQTDLIGYQKEVQVYAKENGLKYNK